MPSLKPGTTRRNGGYRTALFATTCLVSAVSLADPAFAGPAGGSVQAGQAAISAPSSTSTLIRQTSQQAIINWSSFSLGSNEGVTFVQPNAQAITLNRVTGPQASAINGSMAANGQVWLLNPNGVLFGQGAQVNVAGLLATTADIANQDFMAGHYSFTTASSNPSASVVNQGSIVAAAGGSVVLAGQSVENQGLISAQLGSVVLGGA